MERYKPPSGSQEVLDQNILYVIIEKKPIPPPWIEAIRKL
jgi:hypothetical protein